LHRGGAGWAEPAPGRADDHRGVHPPGVVVGRVRADGVDAARGERRARVDDGARHRGGRGQPSGAPRSQMGSRVGEIDAEGARAERPAGDRRGAAHRLFALTKSCSRTSRAIQQTVSDVRGGRRVSGWTPRRLCAKYFFPGLFQWHFVKKVTDCLLCGSTRAGEYTVILESLILWAADPSDRALTWQTICLKRDRISCEAGTWDSTVWTPRRDTAPSPTDPSPWLAVAKTTRRRRPGYVTPPPAPQGPFTNPRSNRAARQFLNR